MRYLHPVRSTTGPASNHGVRKVAIVPVAYDIPDDIYAGLMAGTYSRFGSVVRDHKEIVAHLKEVALPESEGPRLDLGANAAALRKPTVLIGLGIGIAVAGGAFLWSASKKKVAQDDPRTSVAMYNASLVAYLEAVQNGTLDADVIDRLISALDAVKTESDSGTLDIELSTGQSEALVKLVVDYTRRLAEANAVEVSETQGPSGSTEADPVVHLRRHLEAQRDVFDSAA